MRPDSVCESKAKGRIFFVQGQSRMVSSVRQASKFGISSLPVFEA